MTKEFISRRFGTKTQKPTNPFSPRPFAPKLQRKTRSDAAAIPTQSLTPKANRISRMANPNPDPKLGVQPSKSDGVTAHPENQSENIQLKAQGKNWLEKVSIFPPNPPATPSFPIQAKLTEGVPGDRSDREADCVTRQVVNRIEPPQVNFRSSQSSRSLQRKISILTAPLSQIPTIQRKVIIKHPSPQGVSEINDVQGALSLFAKYNIHHDYFTEKALEGHEALDPNITHPKVVEYDDETTAVKDLKDYVTLYNSSEVTRIATDKADKSISSQDVIQRKLIEVFELCRIEANIQLTDDMRQFYKEFIMNGLCGGWVSVHLTNPVTIETLWIALDTWKPPVEGTTQERMKHLQEHLVKFGASQDKNEAVNEVIRMTKAAYTKMDDLYGGYGDFHKVDYRNVTDLVLGNDYELKHTCDINNTDPDLLQKVNNELKLRAEGANKEARFEIETSYHHIGVRSVKTEQGIQWSIVESELVGTHVNLTYQQMCDVAKIGILKVDDLAKDPQDTVTITCYYQK